ncbi:MAG TPA: DUF2252 domain-containing protein [Actinomycetes bacterium]|nr:DUF2252 domain-containing protein [Actinomycetes bacterium]
MASSVDTAPVVEKPPGSAGNGTRPGREHLSPAQRADLGKAARQKSPRKCLGEWQPVSDRADPIAVLEAQGTTRLPELVPLRYGRMLASPFTFYRGAAAIMAADLAATPTSGLTVQACGDAHLSNFGLFGSPERRLVFDINDFDETLPGPWEWDVKRLAASLAIAGRNNGFSAAERRKVVLATAAGYRRAVLEFAAQSNMEVWYARANLERGLPRMREMLGKKGFAQAQKVASKAMAKDSTQALVRLTHLVDGERRIIHDPPLVVPVEELLSEDQAVRFDAWMHALLDAYRQTLPNDRRHLLDGFRYVHLARKVVGVGSVGTRAYIVLMTGRDDQDPLLLQAKEAQVSVLEPFVGASEYEQHGQRVVEGQRLMQASSDIFLGWQRATGLDDQERDFYFRQLRDWKGSWDPEEMSAAVMGVYGQVCGSTLARAHARSGDRIAIASYLGNGDSFDRAVAEFSEAYADQNEADFAALQAAVRTGRCASQTDI